MNYFLYDGNCLFCTNTAAQLKKKCISKDIEFISFREMDSAKLKNIHADLGMELLQANIQFIYKGKRYPHFFGIRKLSFHLSGYRFFAPLLYLPLVPLAGILLMYFLKKRTGH